MGGKSEAFAHTALEVLGNNPNVLPVNFVLPEVRRNLAAFDAPRPRLDRLKRALRTDVGFATRVR